MNQCLFSLMGSYCERLGNNKIESDGSYDDLTELMVIIGKSLVNDKDEEKLSVDVPRLKEELVLWKFYRRGTINCFLFNKDKKAESPGASTGITGILPLIIGNYDFSTLEKTIGSFTSQTNQKSDHLILSLLMGKVVHGVINREEKKSESLIQFLKEYLIHLNYNRVFQDVLKEETTDKISFEKEKIQWIMDLDRISQGQLPLKKHHDGDSKILFIQSLHLFFKHHEEEGYFDIIKNSEVSLEGKVFSLLLRDFKANSNILNIGCDSGEKYLKSGEDLFLKEMDRYFNKLKAFEIGKTLYKREKLKGKDYLDTKALLSMDRGERGSHPILKDFEIVEKVKTENLLCLKVKTKSRYYIFKKPLALG